MEEKKYYWVTVQSPIDEKTFTEVAKELSPISVFGIGCDVEFVFKIRQQDWQKVVKICEKYLLNGTVIGESDKP